LVLDRRLGLTLARRATDDKRDDDLVAREVLQGLDLEGRMIIVNPSLARREVAQAILDGGGDYVMIVGGGQPQLLEEIRQVFQERELSAGTSAATMAKTGDNWIEECCLTTSTALAGDSHWPGLEQVFRFERTVIIKETGQRRKAVAYGVTSLSPEQADAACLLCLLTTPLN
jgi:predicted transposase YbfD/YdcC